MFKNTIIFFMDCGSAVSLLHVQTDSRTKTEAGISIQYFLFLWQWTESMYEAQSYALNGST